MKEQPKNNGPQPIPSSEGNEQARLLEGERGNIPQEKKQLVLALIKKYFGVLQRLAKR